VDQRQRRHGRDHNNYTTAATAPGDNGTMYRCAVTTTCGNSVTSAVATLNIITTPTITTQPTNRTVYASENASFGVTASGATAYQWYKGIPGSGVSLSDGGSVNGSISSVLTVSNLTAGDDGSSFYAVVNGCAGFQTSSTNAILNVLPGTAPFVTAALTPASYSNAAGNHVTFTVTFGGPTPILYQWQFNNGGTNVDLAGATNTTLSLTNLQVTNSGTYMLIASNVFGATSVMATVTITPSTLAPFDVQNFSVRNSIPRITDGLPRPGANRTRAGATS